MHRLQRSDGHLELGLANASDDLELRQFLRDNSAEVPGGTAFLREPSFMLGASVQGHFIQIPIVRREGKIVLIGSRAIRTLRVNGNVENIGYLGDLRVHRDHRRGTLLRAAYRFLQELDRDKRCRFYISVIGESNEAALTTIAANRAGLPSYIDCGRVLVPAVDVSSGMGVRSSVVSRGSWSQLPDIVERLNQCDDQFAPAYATPDFVSGRFPGFVPENFYLILKKGKVASVMGLWDQRSFRQTMILGLAAELNALFDAFGGNPPKIDLVDRVAPVAYICFVATEGPEDYLTLLSQACLDARESAVSHVIVGLHERDTRVKTLHSFKSVDYGVRLYLVNYGDDVHLDDRVPHFDPAFV